MLNLSGLRVYRDSTRSNAQADLRNHNARRGKKSPSRQRLMMTRSVEYERMNLRFLFAIIFCCWPAVALAQMNGRFYLEKDNFAPGEPVFLYFQTRNLGTETQELSAFGAYSSCS